MYAGMVKLVAPPVMYNGQRMEVRRPPPWLSEHTEEVSSNKVLAVPSTLQ
jgi:crotonobetainyl-CoA:carnitine CoA-transferase CaiB-like acyl-CoA transferase